MENTENIKDTENTETEETEEAEKIDEAEKAEEIETSEKKSEKELIEEWLKENEITQCKPHNPGSSSKPKRAKNKHSVSDARYRNI
jgi:hypothetical protein